MNIAIIGAGWVGCHLAMQLKEKHNIKIYEEDSIFSKTSANNQNRLHLGYHYPRDSKTRELCFNSFNDFIKQYGFLTSEVKKNIYVVPKQTSLIDFKTYLKIFDSYDHEIINIDYLNNVDGAILTKERYINFGLAKKYFENNLLNILITKYVDDDFLKIIKLNNDLVINCTHNLIKDRSVQTTTQISECLIYEQINKPSFDALTFIDGKLFSIYPYKDNLFTVTDVEISNNETYTTEIKQKLIEEKILHYYPNFKNDYRYFNSFTSKRVKIEDGTDSRIPVITFDDNLVNIFTGKIQGIYEIERYVKQLCK
jgi:hypothetical protein